MTKRILIAVCSLLLAVVLVLLLPVALTDQELASSPPTPSSTTSAPTGASTTQTPTTVPSNTATVPSTTVPPTTVPTTTVPPTTTTAPPPPGQVRLYTCQQSLREKYVQLAVEYYQLTGIEVILLMPEDGESCVEGLARYMASDVRPTLFCIHEEKTLQQYASQLYDLNGTPIAGQLYSADFGISYQKKLLALPVAVDWFGYIYNAHLLKDGAFSRADFYRNDMTGYNSMAYISQYLTSQKIYPFGKPDFSSADLSALSTVFQDPDQLRSFVDLYVGNTRSTTDALSAFKNGQIVFYPATTAAFDEALSLGIANLDLLPAFGRGCDTMTYICKDFWAVTGVGYDLDVQETLSFLNWMVTAQNGNAAPIDKLDLLSPYKNAAVAHNALERLLREYMAEEPARLVWDRSDVSQEEFADFCAALAAYYAKPSDSTWEKVAQYMKKQEAPAV